MSRRLNSQISALHSIGADAMDNLFDIKITMPKNAIEFGTDQQKDVLTEDHMELQFRLRCEGFEPPKFTQKKYEVRYKTISMNRPAARIEGSREFSLTFRVDAYYRVYSALLNWRSLLFEPSSGYASPRLVDEATSELENYFGQIDVFVPILPPLRSEGGSYDIPGITHDATYDEAFAKGAADVMSDTKVLRAWSFSDVWISDLTEPKFTTGGGEIQKVTATFQFGEYRAPSSPDSLTQ